MPREMSLTSSRPLTLSVLVQAGSAVDGTLVPRAVLGGWAVQLVDTRTDRTSPVEQPDGSGERSADPHQGPQPGAQPGAQPVAVLTVELSRRIDDRFDLERLTGPTGLPADAEVWFTEATAPWGPRGEPGVLIARELARLMAARLIVEDGR